MKYEHGTRACYRQHHAETARANREAAKLAAGQETLL